MSSSSIFSSLGAVLHSLSSFKSSYHSNSIVSRSSSSISKLPNAADSAFESNLAAQLLRLANNRNLYLPHQPSPWPWLCNELAQLVISTNAAAQELLPELRQELSHGDTKWVHHYLDDSIKLLDILHATKASISELQALIVHVELSSRALSKRYLCRSHLLRALSELRHCKQLLSCRSKISDSYRSVMRKMSDRLNNVEDGRRHGSTSKSSGSFFTVSYAARLMSIFACAVFSSIILSKPARNAAFTTVSVHGQHVWATPFGVLQRKLKERIAIRKHGSSLDELQQMELAITALYDKIESLLLHGKISFPLRACHSSALKQRIDGLKVSSEQLKDAVDSLLQSVESMCSVLVTSRIMLLNLCSNTS